MGTVRGEEEVVYGEELDSASAPAEQGEDVGGHEGVAFGGTNAEGDASGDLAVLAPGSVDGDGVETVDDAGS